MKNTIITLASVATLASAANAQVTLGGVTYAPGQGIKFSSQADFIAGTNAAFEGNHGAGRQYDRDFYDGHNVWLNKNTGYLSAAAASATWAAGIVDDFWYDDSASQINVVLNTAGTYAGIAVAAGESLLFATDADFIGGVNGIAGINHGAGSQFDRDFGGGTNTWLNLDTGYLSTAATSATWAAGKVDDYWFNETDQTYTVVVAAVPEPSSTALLGLGGLALILRRKK